MKNYFWDMLRFYVLKLSLFINVSNKSEMIQYKPLTICSKGAGSITDIWKCSQ